MATTNLTMRIDTDVKAKLQELMSDLGLDMTTFFTMAAKQAIREQRIPFEISREVLNSDTREAFREVEEMKKKYFQCKNIQLFFGNIRGDRI